MAARPLHDSSSRRLLERFWILATVGYGVGKAVIVGFVLGRYGVNPWIYAVIEISTSFVLGVASAKTVGAAVDRAWGPSLRWGSLTAVVYFAPDVSLFIMGKGMPREVWITLLLIIVVLAGFTVWSTVGKVRAGRRERAAARAAAAAATEAASDASPAGAPNGPSGAVAQA
jgi:hypothetical protein